MLGGPRSALIADNLGVAGQGGQAGNSPTGHPAGPVRLRARKHFLGGADLVGRLGAPHWTAGELPWTCCRGTSQGTPGPAGVNCVFSPHPPQQPRSKTEHPLVPPSSLYCPLLAKPNTASAARGQKRLYHNQRHGGRMGHRKGVNS